MVSFNITFLLICANIAVRAHHTGAYAYLSVSDSFLFCQTYLDVDNVIHFSAFKHINNNENENENQYVVSENVLAVRQIKNNEG